MVEANAQTEPYLVPLFLALLRSFCPPMACPWMQMAQLITLEPTLELPA